MRLINSALLLLCGFVVMLAACSKVDDLPFYEAGKNPTLSASSTTIAPAPTDSNNVVLTMSWTDPKYATDSAKVKYVIEIDSVGKNFASAKRFEVMGARSKTFTAKELNTILVDRGYAFSTPVSMEARLISSYSNNNEQLYSNVVKLSMTPYKVPPKVALPTSNKLFLVGDASQGGWNNPVPTPAQEFARIDETTWAGIFQLNAGGQFLVLPENGNWDKKFALENNTIPGIEAGGSFGYFTNTAPSNFTQNFKGPGAAGWYRITLDFQTGKFTTVPYAGTMPQNGELFIVGDATAGGWNNPVPVPSQRFTRVNSSVWEITMPLVGGGQFLILPVNGDWSKKYAVDNNNIAGITAGGDFGYHVDGQPAPDIFGDNFKAPTTSGTYTIRMNFAAIPGDATASGKFTIQ